jgi:hypothetical protein
MTLKIVSMSIDGILTASIFSGCEISHTERIIPIREAWGGSDVITVGEVGNPNSEQWCYVSYVNILDKDVVKRITVLPKSDCYIMEDGKTVDSFHCIFCDEKQV